MINYILFVHLLISPVVQTSNSQFTQQESAVGKLNNDKLEDRVVLWQDSTKPKLLNGNELNNTKCDLGNLEVYLGIKNSKPRKIISTSKLFSNDCSDYVVGYFPKITNKELVISYFIGADAYRIDAYFVLSKDNSKLILTRFKKFVLRPDGNRCLSYQINVDTIKGDIVAINRATDTPVILFQSKMKPKHWDSTNFIYFQVFDDDISSFVERVATFQCKQ